MATPSAPPSATNSEYAPSELLFSEFGDDTSPAPRKLPVFPPYPPYATEPMPPSVADTIHAGRDLRVKHKSVTKKPVRPPPRPAKPRGPKVTDVALSGRALRAHARCLRRHGAVLTDRLERLARPQRRTILYLWREHNHTLPAETIARLRNMLDADEPFKPDQAYDYFVNLRKHRKATATPRGVRRARRELAAVCADKRFVWARNATVTFARGIQRRLTRPGRYALADSMLRLSNIVLDEICGYMCMRPPPRCCNHPKSRFMVEMADKVAVWINEILSESDDRMLMMDFDEDDDVLEAAEAGDADFPDDFLNMMGGAGGRPSGSKPAHLQFTGDTRHAFNIVTESMDKKGQEHLLSYNKFNQTYAEGAKDLRSTPDYTATNYNKALARELNQKLADTSEPHTPAHLKPHVDGMVEICSNFLAQKVENHNASSKKGIGHDGAGGMGAGPGGKGAGAGGTGAGGTGAGGAGAGGTGAGGTGAGGAGAGGTGAGGTGAGGTGAGGAGAGGTGAGGTGAGGTGIGSEGKGASAGGAVAGVGEARGGADAGSGGVRFGGTATVAGGLGTQAGATGAEPGVATSGGIGAGASGSGSTGTGAPEGLATAGPNAVSSNAGASIAGAGGTGTGSDRTGVSGSGTGNLGTGGPGSSGHGTGGPGTNGTGIYGPGTGGPGTGGPGTGEPGTGGPWTGGTMTNGSGAGGSGTGGPGTGGSGTDGSGTGGPGTGGPGTSGPGTSGPSTAGSGTSGPGIGGHGAGGPGTGGFGTGEKRAGGRGSGAKVGGDSTDDESLSPPERARRAADRARRGVGGGLGGDGLGESDADRAQALQILHSALRERGAEALYRQPQTELTHAQASAWLEKAPPVDKSVKQTADTGRLANKLERKLGALVSKVTPADMQDVMQDVIIESSRRLSECFVSKNYKTLVREALISEMQRRGNEILVELGGAAETFFFAAQRLKTADISQVKEPHSQVAYRIAKKLEDMIRRRTMARKLSGTMKDHIKDAADYLSEVVTKPDEKIEAYVSLLGEMEAAGDSLLIDKDIKKSNKDAAAYLRQLTSYEDQIRRADSSLQTATEAKLKHLMSNVVAGGYSPAVMSSVIAEATRLLVSYIKLQDEKTEALRLIIEQMDKAGENLILRHGPIRKSFAEAASLLRGKNTDQLSVQGADPVVSRKIQIKLTGLMHGSTADKYQALIDDVIEDATVYLAVSLLQSRVLRVCKCKKNVFVQCELWCDEMLRRVSRPCCSCSRHVSTQALADLAPHERLRLRPGSSRAFAPGTEISLTPCTSRPGRSPTRRVCPAPHPTPGCNQTYLLYATQYDYPHHSPIRLPFTPSDSLQTVVLPSPFTNSPSFSPVRRQIATNYWPVTATTNFLHHHSDSSSLSFHTPQNSMDESVSSPLSPFAPVKGPEMTVEARKQLAVESTSDTPMFGSYANVGEVPRSAITLDNGQGKAAYNSGAPIVSTNQMSDWHAMVVSLVWNVRAWRGWVQDNVDRALGTPQGPDISQVKAEENWSKYFKKVTTEALQWRQYTNFSRQLMQRLSIRYGDKDIVSPTRATIKTDTYKKYQEEMIKIIDMLCRWTRWLVVVVRETEALETIPGSDVPLHKLRWSYFKRKVSSCSDDWAVYNLHLKSSWEDKYTAILSTWLPAAGRGGPVWVVSACGAVPSGAVAAGRRGAECVWLARTTHKCDVLPAALCPSKHCCLVYAGGAVHHYTRYQVLCNARVKWVSRRAGAADARAVRVAPGVLVGRVRRGGAHLVGPVRAPRLRCHVAVCGRQCAYSCYELLVLCSEDDS